MTELSEYKDILKIEDMIKILHISKGKAYSLVKNGEIKSLRIGRIIRIPKFALVDYIGEMCENNIHSEGR